MRPAVPLLALLACRPGEPPAPRVDPGSPAPAAPAPAAPAQIDLDLDLLLAGAPPPAPLARARAQADAYARRLAARLTDPTQITPSLVDLEISATLALLRRQAPDSVAAAAGQFLPVFTALSIHDLDPPRRRRLAEQTALTRLLAGGLDRPRPAVPNPGPVDRVCLAAGPDGPALTVERDCTCGDVLACEVRVVGDALELAVDDLPALHMCSDCYPSWTSCTLPATAGRPRLRLQHVDLGPLPAAAGECLPAAPPSRR